MECGEHFARQLRLHKEFNTEGAENAEDTEKKESAEQIFVGGADDARGGFGGGLVTIAANQDNRDALRLAHEETGSGGELIGDGENGGGERLAVAIRRVAQIMENGNARRANGHVGQTKTPGAAEGVANDDGHA